MVWLQPLSALSPATYTLSACRKLVGIGNPGSVPGNLMGAPLSAVMRELIILALMGAVLMPLLGLREDRDLGQANRQAEKNRMMRH